ncbi:hypothetical protein LPJ64_004800, partial [Coemansia asiatica]
LLGSVTIAQGGVLPNIHATLLPQKSKKANASQELITNVDALKSPFPRHLRQHAQNSPSVGSASTRPALNSAEDAQRTIRPLPGHSAPRWQFTASTAAAAATSSEVSVSPVGSSAQQNSALDFGYIRPASYRLPAGYPSSVQPIRARPYPTGGDSRFIPGSTLPTHIVPSGISRTNAADSGSQCHLQNWYLVLDTVKGHVSVHGNSVNSEGVYVVRRSSAILQTLSDRSLVTAKGSCYKLVGPANVDMMQLKGFPEHLIPYFADGFPHNWRQLLDSFLGKPASAGYAKAQSTHTLGTEAIVARPKTASIKHSESFEEPRSAILPSSSGLRGSTFNNQTLSPESPSVQSRAQGNPSSVYSSGSSLFASRKFVSNFSPKARRASGGDQNEAKFDSTTLQEEGEGDELEQIAETPFVSISGTKPVDLLSLGSETESAFEHRSKRLTHRVSFSKENESDLNELLDKSAASIASTRTITPSASASKRRPSRKVIDNSDELNGQKENPLIEAVSDPKMIADSEIDGITSIDTPPKPPRQKVVKANLARRTSTRRLSRETSTLLPSVRQSNSATKASPVSTPPNHKPSPAKAAAIASSKRVSRSSISRITRSAQKGLLVSDEQVTDGSQTSEGSLISGTDTEAGLVTAAQDNAESTKAAVAEAVEEPFDDMKLNLGGNTDESEEPSVGKPSVTPKRRVRVPGQASARKVISDSSDGESQLETPLTKHSEAESQNQQELKTPRSGIKWKTGRRYFRYKEPETNSSSITRSGRKVRKPQDWWANAQDHLAGSGNSHKECNIKYKWGSGDAMVVKGGKRMRLSDFYLQGGDEIALFNEEAPDTNEVDDGLEEQKSE